MKPHRSPVGAVVGAVISGGFAFLIAMFLGEGAMSNASCDGICLDRLGAVFAVAVAAALLVASVVGWLVWKFS